MNVGTYGTVHVLCCVFTCFMSAGIVPIAHNSGGPKMDIVIGDAGGPVGFLCESVEDYARAITQVLSMDQNERMEIAAAARRCAPNFVNVKH